MRKWIHKIISLPCLDKYVIFSIAFTIVYTILEFIFSVVTNVSHDVLTECVYKFFAGEVIMCALIKIFKLVPSKTVIKEKLEQATGFSFTEEDMDDGK